MKAAVTGSQMKQIDQDTIGRIGIPSLVLMERAALAVADAAEKMWKGPGGGSFVAVCGTGNNGADGIAAGRILHGRGYPVRILLAGDPERGTSEYQLQRQIAGRLGIPMETVFPGRAETPVSAADRLSQLLPPGGAEAPVSVGERLARLLPSRGIVLDALFGIGLGRDIEGLYRELVEGLNSWTEQTGSPVVAVDIPSGIHSGTGAVMGTAIRAAETVTFGYLKSGLLLYPGKEYAGTVTVADIGFSEESLRQAGWDALVWEKADLGRLPRRRPDGNKGTFGKLLLIAGSVGMSGAAYLSALAAYRSGAGLVRILTVEENRGILQTRLPEAIVDTYEPEQAMEREEEFCTLVEEKCDWADTIVMGPGLGREPYVERLVETVLAHAYVPVVLDADGLNTVAAHPYLTRYFTENIIITPHMGEMSRLTGRSISELKADPVAAAREYAAGIGATCVLKDAATVIADKEGTVYINPSGCSAMAKAGSGDVLTGVIGALLAQGMEGSEAASCGVYLHGLAGEAAAAELGERCLLAGDIADYLFK